MVISPIWDWENMLWRGGYYTIWYRKSNIKYCESLPYKYIYIYVLKIRFPTFSFSPPYLSLCLVLMFTSVEKFNKVPRGLVCNICDWITKDRKQSIAAIKMSSCQTFAAVKPGPVGYVGALLLTFVYCRPHCWHLCSYIQNRDSVLTEPLSFLFFVNMLPAISNEFLLWLR